MNQPSAPFTREGLPENVRWLCDNCRYAIPAGKAFMVVAVHRCIRQDNRPVPVDQVSNPLYYCEDCAESLDFDFELEARSFAQ